MRSLLARTEARPLPVCLHFWFPRVFSESVNIEDKGPPLSTEQGQDLPVPPLLCHNSRLLVLLLEKTLLC